MTEEPAEVSEDAGSTSRLVVAVVLLLAFAALVVVMMIEAKDVSEITWNRQVYLLGGVEAIVFAAVGWLFGREVHRSEAVSAKADAADAKKRAAASEHEAKASMKEAVEERTKGLAVKAAVRHLAEPTVVRTFRGAGASIVAPNAEPDVSDSPQPPGDLLGMVEELWPD